MVPGFSLRGKPGKRGCPRCFPFLGKVRSLPGLEAHVSGTASSTSRPGGYATCSEEQWSSSAFLRPVMLADLGKQQGTPRILHIFFTDLAAL